MTDFTLNERFEILETRVKQGSDFGSFNETQKIVDLEGKVIELGIAVKDIKNMNDSSNGSFPSPLNRSLEMILSKVRKLEQG
jgi:hypothetical protein